MYGSQTGNAEEISKMLSKTLVGALDLSRATVDNCTMGTRITFSLVFED
jgi:flavodoxin